MNSDQPTKLEDIRLGALVAALEAALFIGEYKLRRAPQLAKEWFERLADCRNAGRAQAEDPLQPPDGVEYKNRVPGIRSRSPAETL